MGMGGGRPGVPKATKPVIRPTKKLQNFNWRRVLVTPKDTPGKKNNLWDDIVEAQLDMDEFEELFENKKKEVVTNTDSGKVVNVLKKKTYFDPTAQQNILITLNKLPKPDMLKEACTNLEEKLITQDQITAMLRIFPAADVIEGLIEEAKATPEEEKWDKGEEYFLQIIDMKSLKQRLVVWQFKIEFPEKRDIVVNT